MTREQQCVQAEMEYRNWRECPLWYCVKTILHLNGKMESDFVRDEKSKLPITIQDLDKPQDGVYETLDGTTTYYTYHQGYEEAARQIAAATI